MKRMYLKAAVIALLLSGVVLVIAEVNNAPSGIIYMLRSAYDTDGNGIVDQAEGAWATNLVTNVIENIFTDTNQIIAGKAAGEYHVESTSAWDKDSSDDITTGDVDNVTLEMSGGALQVKDGGIDTNKVSAGILASLGSADSATQPGDAVTTLDGTAHRILYVDASGNVTELAYGTDGQVLTSTGASSAPAFEDAAPGSGSASGGGFVSMGDLVYIPGSGVFDAGGGPAVWDYESAYYQITARGSVEYGSTIKDREYRFFWNIDTDGAQTNTLRYAGMSADSTNAAKAFLYLQLEDANSNLVYNATNGEFAVSEAYTIYSSNILYSATGHVFGTVITGSADTNGIGFIDFR